MTHGHTRQMPDRARRLFRASTELLHDLDLDRIVRTVVTAMRDITHADAASLSLVRDGYFEFVAHDGLSEHYVRSQRIPFDAGRALYAGRPEQHALIDLSESPIGDRELYRSEGLAKVLAVPLTKDGELIGALNAYLKDGRASFDEQDIDLAHVLAVEASIAIANARQYTEVVQQREFQRALLESLGTAVIVARPPDVITMMNEAARQLTGMEGAEERSIRDVFVRFDARDARTNEPLRTSVLLEALAGRELSQEISMTNLDTGERRIVFAMGRSVRDTNGAVTAAVATMHDLTELRQLEEEKEQFLSIVSHELRTPLTPLKALAQLQVSRIHRAQQRGEPLDLEGLERNLLSIERQVDRMNGLVSDLLSVSRAGRGKLEMDRRPFDLATSVRDTVERYVQATREEGRHRFVVEAPNSLVVNADQARVEQLLMNLIGNAVKYSPRGGEVRVSLKGQDGTAEIVIVDEGIGITPADLPRLGTAFTRGTGKAATFAGMGIGLHVARLLAVAHGGSLELESPGEDRGTTVRVKLPA